MGVYTHVRVTRGDDESAACGQLVTIKQQKQQQKDETKSQTIIWKFNPNHELAIFRQRMHRYHSIIDWKFSSTYSIRFLSNNKLNGTIPFTIGHLTQLTAFSISANGIVPVN